MTTTCDVALIGRDSITRESLKHLLSEQGRHIVYAGSSLDECCAVATAETRFLLILIEDKRLQWDGTAVADLHRRCRAGRIIVLAEEFDYASMLDAFRAGVQGYLTNDLSWERLAGYLDLISLGEKIFPSKLAERLMDQCIGFPAVKSSATMESVNLSAREMEILQRLIAGLPNKIISRQLAISEATVKVHVKAVLRKLGVVNRTQAAIWAAGQGLRGSGSTQEPAIMARRPLEPRYAPAIDGGALPPRAQVTLKGGFGNGHAGRA